MCESPSLKWEPDPTHRDRRIKYEVLMAASSLDLILRGFDDGEREVIGTLRWPAALEREARAFITDNLLAERCGDPRRAAQLLSRGVLRPDERARFLAEKPAVLPEPPGALKEAIDLEDFVAEFSVALGRLRRAAPDLTLHFEWR